MAQQTPIRAIKEAKKIAEEFGLLVIEKPGRFLLYRKLPHRNVYIGFRSDIAEFRRFVEACAYDKKAARH